MNKDKLITKQQLEIESLKEQCQDMYKNIKDIYSLMYCVGGPLNDNLHGFNNKQLDYLDKVGGICTNTVDEYYGEHDDR